MLFSNIKNFNLFFLFLFFGVLISCSKINFGADAKPPKIKKITEAMYIQGNREELNRENILKAHISLIEFYNPRSEERRVGKGCRFRWQGSYEKNEEKM